MKYYEVAAKWWADKLRNNKSQNYTNNYNKTIELFEKTLAETIKDNVDKKGHMILNYNKESDSLFFKIAKRTGININSIPANVSMFIRPYNITVYTDVLGNYKTIYLQNP